MDPNTLLIVRSVLFTIIISAIIYLVVVWLTKRKERGYLFQATRSSKVAGNKRERLVGKKAAVPNEEGSYIQILHPLSLVFKVAIGFLLGCLVFWICIWILIILFGGFGVLSLVKSII